MAWAVTLTASSVVGFFAVLVGAVDDAGVLGLVWAMVMDDAKTANGNAAKALVREMVRIE
ncbi:hypothetical protein GCM10011408_41580 [Dyella caseinilytica]|nr:hypothetical protein GCM10011408_41580 [Dyella caseinilytica]